MKLAQGLSPQLENLVGLYKLLFLLTLEFSEPGVLHMVLYLNKLQKLAVESDLPLSHCNALHAVVAGILYLISKISSSIGLQEHILQIIAVRRASAAYLLPDSLFGPEDKSDGVEKDEVKLADKAFLFVLDEDELLRMSPEPRKTFGKKIGFSNLVFHRL